LRRVLFALAIAVIAVLASALCLAAACAAIFVSPVHGETCEGLLLTWSAALPGLIVVGLVYTGPVVWFTPREQLRRFRVRAALVAFTGIVGLLLGWAAITSGTLPPWYAP
jgi:hypothetical protein